MLELHAKHCVPCRGGVPPLGREEAASLFPDVPGWELRDEHTRLFRSFAFENYADALAFVNAISVVAEAEGHHPDICVGWGYAKVTLYTHKINGLHQNDFIMAAKFGRVFAGEAAA